MTSTWSIEGLARAHDRKTFDCGVPELNEFLRKHARQQQDRRINRTFVALKAGEDGKRVCGFYSLSAGSVEFESMPASMKKKLARYPVPVVRLGRLAVDQCLAGTGLGAVLLRDALRRVMKVSQSDLGVFAVVVDAKDEQAVGFYKHYGFIQFQDSERTLFLPVKTIAEAFTGD